MEKKFIVPATTMLAGIIVWVMLLLVNSPGGNAPWMELLLGITAGGFIYFSAVRCKKAGGPRGGNIFRTILLLAFAVLSYLFIGTASAVVLLIAGIVTSLLIFNGSQQAAV